MTQLLYKDNQTNIVIFHTPKNGVNNLTIDKYKVTTTGSSADGINLGKESHSSTITIGDNAEIDAWGMGVRVNSSVNGTGENLIILSKNTQITSHEGGSNLEIGSSEFGTGYGVYAGNTNSSAIGSARLVIDDNSQIDFIKVKGTSEESHKILVNDHYNGSATNNGT